MPRPTRKKSTLQKIAEQGFGFSGTTKSHADTKHFPEIDLYRADRHHFFVDKEFLRAVIKKSGKDEVLRRTKQSFTISLGYALNYAGFKFDILGGHLKLHFNKVPWVLYSFDIGQKNMYVSLRSFPVNETFESKRPFRYFEIKEKLVMDAFDLWKKKYVANNFASGKEDFAYFLNNYLYRRFLVKIIREHKSSVQK